MESNIKKLILEALNKDKSSVITEQEDLNAPHRDWNNTFEKNFNYNENGMGTPHDKSYSRPWAFKYNYQGHNIDSESDDDGNIFSTVTHPDGSLSRGVYSPWDNHGHQWKWSRSVNDTMPTIQFALKHDIQQHIDRFIKAYKGGE